MNIGAGTPTQLMDYIGELERALGKTAIKNFLPMQQGDVPATEASSVLLKRLTGTIPTTPPSAGVPAFVRWYLDHYRS
ncbi:hypothetical protein [Sphingomonas sp. S2-65]|uniref:hypothetical protein n=1 Tax=Sphingomonas sp. S2-65 TaxID=2903960 RepID=UPI0029E81D06|nr:hypothetical protein [Sphingomonas sp. S2-65]